MSKFRKQQLVSFIFRCIIFVLGIILFILYLNNNQFSIKQFEILKGFNFFKSFSLLHLLWIIWVFDMFMQIIPLSNKIRNKLCISMGIQKAHKIHYQSTTENINQDKLIEQIKKANKKAYLILFLWFIAITLLSLISIIIKHLFNIDQHTINISLFLITLLFYIFDTICTIIWCPFKMIQKNKCCVTCRIYNYDHMMLTTPMITIPSFFSWSLIIFGLIILVKWEIDFRRHPERFFKLTNQNLKCKNCTDKRCKKKL